MKKIKLLLQFSVLVLILTACSTGKNAYEKGDYYKACMESIDRLRSNPKSEKALSVLTSSYPLALTTAERDIQNALLTNENERYDILVFQYERINQLANEIYHSPKAYEAIPTPKEYIAELKEAKNRAASRAYNLGLTTYKQDDIDQSRLAYQYFLKANQYVPGYKDVLKKIEEARYESTLRVIVQKPLTSNNYQYTADFFYNNLIAEMSRETRNKLVRFYTVEEAQNEKMRHPHQIMILNFEDFSVGNIREKANTMEVKRDSVIVGTVKVDGKTYNSYNTVKATITIFKREVISKGILSLRIIDASNERVLQQRNFAGEYNWKTEWANYKGDDKALNKDEKKLCTREPQTPPTHQDLFIEFTKPIYTQVVSYVRSMYSGRY